MYRKNKIIESYNKYVAWWLPIDIADNSSLAPMTFNRFCETLLIFPDENWWNRWVNGFSKRDVLNIIKNNIYDNMMQP